MVRALKLVAVPFVFFSTLAAAQTPAAIPVGKEPYTVAGQGGPVIVLDAGFGDDRRTWTPVFSALATESTVFAFDRPGYQASEDVVNPATTADDGRTTLSEQANNLHALLARAGLAPPYVLVGHSLGALSLLGFVREYPDEVVGIVFVDGRLPTYTAACQAAGIPTCAPTRERMAGRPEFMLAELDGSFGTETTEAATVAELGDIPVTLMVAVEPPDPESGEVDPSQEIWRAEQKRFAEELADARHIELSAPHYIHAQQPDRVIAEIKRMLIRAKTGAWPAP